MRRAAPALLLGALCAALPALALPPAPALPCPTNALCSCRSNEISCVGLPIHRLPEWPSLSLEHVDISMATLETLPENALDGLQLSTLVLVANRLRQIRPKAFSSMTSTLSSLDLGYNEFTEIPFVALKELKVLNWLNLQNNNIVNISNSWSHMDKTLGSLLLGNNHIVNITASSFYQLNHLEQLDLEGNRIRYISPRALPKSLSVLKLSNNLLNMFPCHLIINQPHLKKLILRNNLLYQLNDCKLNEIKRLEMLDLSDNNIKYLKGYIIHKNLHIRQLNLDYNSLTTIPENIFNHMKVEKLSISFNKLIDIGGQIFLNLQHSLDHLDLDYNQLTHLPGSIVKAVRLRHMSISYNMFFIAPSLPPNLQMLSLAGNFLNVVPRDQLKGLTPKSLRSLDLSYNHISYISSADFLGWCGALITLNLKGNKISKLDAYVFPKAMPVREILLSFNDLYFIHADSFSNISTTLQELELSMTLFNGDFPVNWLTSLDNTGWAAIDNNNIHTISSNDLKVLTTLQYLDLDFNKIVNFPKELVYFNSTFSVQDFRLSYNFIENLYENMFAMFPIIQNIDLSYNHINRIPTNCFNNLPELLLISLTGNMINTVENFAFLNLPKLFKLEIQENKLTRFSLNSFRNISHNGLTLNLSQNYISQLDGSENIGIEVLDCSYNLLNEVPKMFLLSLGNTLRRLILSHNNISFIDTVNFETLARLEILNLHKNNIKFIKRRAFNELVSLQILDLSHNQISQISTEQFANLKQLRFLTLSNNDIKNLPRDIYKNTLLEHIDLSFNRISTYPNMILAQVGFTLRYLDLSHNELEHMHNSVFQNTPFLLDLLLNNNKLTILSDNTFTSLSRLQKLDLAYNSIKANYKELFHTLPSLKYLNLAGTDLKAIPYLPLFNLTYLNLTSNQIHKYNEENLRSLYNLRELYLNRNKFNFLVPNMWTHFKYLKTLDLSENPLRRIDRDSFKGLKYLLHLKLNYLFNLDSIETEAFRALTSLRSLYVQTWSHINNFTFRLVDIVTKIESLHKLVIQVTDAILDDQLDGVFQSKLKHLELWGENLKFINQSAFQSSTEQRELYLRITDTNISDLPVGFMEHLGQIPHLGLDLSNNRLTTLSPAAFYPNVTSWNRVATKLLPGGLLLDGNPLRCSCSLAWAGGWLRRWLRESGGGVRALRSLVRAPKCYMGARAMPLLQLYADEADCHASALSARALMPRPVPWTFFVFTTTWTLFLR